MLLDDIRYAGRMLANHRGFTAAAIVCLALGIGATTAIFSVVHAVLLKPLGYVDSDRLVRIYTEFPKFPNGGLRRFPVSPPEFFELRRDIKSFQAVEAWQTGGATLAGRDESLRATVAYVTGGMLRMLGVPPILGRTLSDADDERGAPLTAVLSYGLWQRAFGGDPQILGRDIRHDGDPCIVAGVMPKGFEFPAGEADEADLWVPLQLDRGRDTSRGNHRLEVLGRLKAGVSFEQARDEMDRYVRVAGEHAPPRTHSFEAVDHTILLAGYRDEVVRNVRLAMLVLLGAVAFVLLISSVNVANLLLARAEGRRREIAIRKAMGAGLGRMIVQFMVEGLVLASLGAVAGLVLAYGGLRMMAALNAGSIPRSGEIAVDGSVLLFTIVVSAATGVGFGMAPVMHLVGTNLHEALKAAAGRLTANAAANQFRWVLVTAELALSLVLLIGTGLMVKAFWRLQAVNPGFTTANIATARVTLPRALYAKPERRAAFWKTLEERAGSLAGVQSAAVAVFIPPVEYLLANDTLIEGFVPKPGGPMQNVDHYNGVGPKYFDTLGIHLLDGRAFDERDALGAPEVVIVNQTMARTFWGAESAVGRRVKPSNHGNWRTVVGVVADVKNAGLDRPTGTELYFPEPQASEFGGDTTATILVRERAGRDAMRLAPAIREQIRSIDPAAAVSAVRPMEDVVSAARSRPRFIAVLLTLFSAVSMVLAALGIYGVMSYSVAQRTSEIGIRIALGAESRDVLGMVIRDGVFIAAAGTLAGTAGAFALTRVLRGLLFGVSAVDAPTFVAMAAVLIAVTLVACYVPARRAARTDPMIALRYE